ncbi:MAG: hypothetical protein B7X59_15280 [Polaromonas sp. 39-63-203]|nr:MAG: hypothetical protein B7X59_15280 [Polaromonas sp. 39-63-203]
MQSAVAAPVCKVHWAGVEVHLLPERALWWPQGRTLFIADLHMGKAATYRALGQPVPGGTTQENLDRVSALIARHSPQQVIFLGDFLHAAAARTANVMAALAQWRLQHAAVGMTLVRLSGRGRDSLRMPCFVAQAGQAVLPAFGEFTGGWMVGAEQGRRLYPVGGGVVWCLPAAA